MGQIQIETKTLGHIANHVFNGIVFPIYDMTGYLDSPVRGIKQSTE